MEHFDIHVEHFDDRRKKLRHIKKGFIDKEQEAEMVPAYSCGAF